MSIDRSKFSTGDTHPLSAATDLRSIRHMRMYKLVMKSGYKFYTHTTQDARLKCVDVRGDGGTFDADDLDMLYLQMGKDLAKFVNGDGPPMYFIEYPLRSPGQPTVLPLIFDLDFKISPDAMNFEDYHLLPLAMAVQQCIRHHIFKDLDVSSYECYVVSAGITRVEKDDGTAYIKAGLHLTLPDIPVNAAVLPLVRRRIVVELEGLYSDNIIPGSQSGMDVSDNIKILNSMEDVVDLAVMKNPSQRMFGSCKAVACKCKKLKETCPDTHGRGREHAGRCEILLCVLDGEATIDATKTTHYQQNYTACFKRLSLIIGVHGKPALETDLDSSYQESRFGQASTTTQMRSTTVDANDERGLVINQILNVFYPRETCAGAYSVGYTKKTKTYIISFHPNGNFCPNKMAHHSGNRVCLVIDKFKMRRRCFSEGREGRIFGPCSEFEVCRLTPPRCLLKLFGISFVPKPFHKVIFRPQRLKLHEDSRGQEAMKFLVELRHSHNR